MLRFLLPLALCLFSSAARAECAGSDLRPTLPADTRAALATRLDAMPYATGNHWRATRDGEVVHLVGTIHLDDARLDAPFERLRPLLDRADRILLEITPEGAAQLQEALKTEPGLLMLTETTLPELLDEADWQRLAEAAAARGLPAFMAAKFRPWYLATLLALPPCAMSSMRAGGTGMDGRITTLAVREGIPLQPLEPFDTGFRAFASTSREDQLAMLMSSILPAGVAEDMFATLLATYFEERHAESWEVSQLLSARLTPLPSEDEQRILDQMTQVLLTARNRAWIPVIKAAAAKGGLTVAAFGAAHLSGKTGVLALLEDEGFMLERQPF